MEIPATLDVSFYHLLQRGCNTHFQAERTYVGSVLFDESHVRTQNSSQPSASTGTSIFQSRHA